MISANEKGACPLCEPGENVNHGKKKLKTGEPELCEP